MPALVTEVLAGEAKIRAVAHEIAEARDVLFLGRGATYPIAMEGALKLKELSYIHAEGYAAGEMKHGPIALIDEEMPVIVVAPDGRALREDRVQSAGGGGARRPGDPDRRQGRHRTPRAQGRPCHRGAGGRSLRGPDHLRRAGAASRLSRRRRQGHRRRPAPQPGEERHGGVGLGERADLICDKDRGHGPLELEGLTAFVQLTDKPPQSYRYW